MSGLRTHVADSEPFCDSISIYAWESVDSVHQCAGTQNNVLYLVIHIFEIVHSFSYIGSKHIASHTKTLHTF